MDIGDEEAMERTSQALRDAGRNEIAPVGIPTPHVDKTNEAIQDALDLFCHKLKSRT